MMVASSFTGFGLLVNRERVELVELNSGLIFQRREEVLIQRNLDRLNVGGNAGTLVSHIISLSVLLYVSETLIFLLEIRMASA